MKTAPLSSVGFPYTIRASGAYACLDSFKRSQFHLSAAIDASYCIDAPDAIEAGPVRYHTDNPANLTCVVEDFTAPAIVWIR